MSDHDYDPRHDRLRSQFSNAILWHHADALDRRMGLR